MAWRRPAEKTCRTPPEPDDMRVNHPGQPFVSCDVETPRGTSEASPSTSLGTNGSSRCHRALGLPRGMDGSVAASAFLTMPRH